MIDVNSVYVYCRYLLLQVCLKVLSVYSDAGNVHRCFI